MANTTTSTSKKSPKKETWTLTFCAGWPAPGPEENKLSTIIVKEFEAINDTEAKQLLLKILQKIYKRLKYPHKRPITDMASPWIEEWSAYDDNRMLRLKDRYCNRRILQIKNPDVALVQGYGTEALKKLAG